MSPSIRWPAAPNEPRIAFVGTLAGSQDLKAETSATEVFKAVFRGARPPIRFSGPHAVALGPGDRVAVADSSGGAVHVLDLVGRTHYVIVGFEGTKLGAPVGVAWLGNNLLVSDAQRHEVIELDAEGVFRRRFGHDVLRRPVGITVVAERNQVYVVDGDAHDIVVFDASGQVVRRIGRRGSDPGSFNYPTHICASSNRLLVADSGNFRVQLLDLDGAPISVIGKKGDAAGDLSLPKGVAFDRDGHIYVVDAHFENVQVFGPEGQLLMAFGEEGAGPGRFALPAGLAIGPDDRIWVADSGNRRIQVFQYLRSAS